MCMFSCCQQLHSALLVTTANSMKALERRTRKTKINSFAFVEKFVHNAAAVADTESVVIVDLCEPDNCINLRAQSPLWSNAAKIYRRIISEKSSSALQTTHLLENRNNENLLASAKWRKGKLNDLAQIVWRWNGRRQPKENTYFLLCEDDDYDTCRIWSAVCTRLCGYYIYATSLNNKPFQRKRI